MSRNPAKDVGIVFDSVSNNTGDKAMGIVMSMFCEEQGFEYEIVDPLRFNPKDYRVVVIGGGLLLREPGDPFYDNYRVHGQNTVLNAVGLAALTDLEYLNEYKYVTVRSDAENKRLSRFVKNVKTVPCITTMMYGDDRDLPNFGNNAIGIHLAADILVHIPNMMGAINKAPGDKVFIPFTHYNDDKGIMSSLPDVGLHMVLDNLEPMQLYSVLGKMKCVITTSLHASIFAYLQNVPFLTFYQEKTYDYFKDRGLENRVFRDEKDLLTKLHLLEAADFKKLIETDKKNVKKHLRKIATIVKESPPSNDSWITRIKSTTNDSIKHEQLVSVVHGRDLLIKQLYAENQKLDTKSARLQAELTAIKSTRYWKLASYIKRKLS